MQQLDIANIEAFVSVAELQSVSDAAKRIGVTQPAISKRIASLESGLQENLFNRIGRRIILTEAGQLILPKCKNILDAISDTKKTLENLSGTVGGILKIGTSHHIGLHQLPPILRRFTRLYPDVELDIHFMNSEKAYENVQSGELELAIITLPNQIADNLVSRLLWDDPMRIVVAKQHELSKEPNITLQQLTLHNAILPNRHTYTRNIIEEVFKKNNLSLKTRLSTDYLETIKMMVSVGLGWSILPESLVDTQLKQLNLEHIKFKRKLGYIQLKNRTLSNAAVAMTSLLKSN